MRAHFASVEEYFASAPEPAKDSLAEVRRLILEAVPGASERIGYQIPGVFLGSAMVIYYAAYRRHIGLYPGTQAIEDFAAELKEYKTAKGSVQLPLDRPLPVDLIRRIVAMRVAAAKKKAKP